jgi:hypothetical protein
MQKSGTCQGEVHAKVRNGPRSGTRQGQVHAKVRYTPMSGTCQCLLLYVNDWYSPKSFKCQGQVHAKIRYMLRSGTRQGQVHAKVKYTLLNLKSLVRGVPNKCTAWTLCFAKDFWLSARLKVLLPSIALEGVICWLVQGQDMTDETWQLHLELQFFLWINNHIFYYSSYK